MIPKGGAGIAGTKRGRQWVIKHCCCWGLEGELSQGLGAKLSFWRERSPVTADGVQLDVSKRAAPKNAVYFACLGGFQEL